MYVLYVYMYVCVCIYIYIYIYTEEVRAELQKASCAYTYRALCVLYEFCICLHKHDTYMNIMCCRSFAYTYTSMSVLYVHSGETPMYQQQAEEDLEKKLLHTRYTYTDIHTQIYIHR